MSPKVLIAIACLALAGCAAHRQAAAPSEPNPLPAKLPAPPQLALELPAGWQLVPQQPGTVLDGVVYLVINPAEKVTLVIGLYPSAERTPPDGAATLAARFRAGGGLTSEIDAATDGSRASFTCTGLGPDGSVAKKGKVLVRVLPATPALSILAIGFWPPDTDARMLAAFDAIVGSARMP